MNISAFNIDSPYAFTVCRIEPENNIHIILEAFTNTPSMQLLIVGNWKKNKYGNDLFQKNSIKDKICLHDPIYDPNILNVFRKNCTFYLHGHSCGGTNPSLVEAMYLGLPIIAFDVSFNRETTENKAIYFSNAKELKSLLSAFEESKRIALGKEMKEIAFRRYLWKRICERYAAIF